MMTGSPLGQLADLLRRVEAKTRAQELIDEVRAAAEQLRDAERAIREAETRDRKVRPARLREIEISEEDEVLLKELIRRTAQNRALMGAEELHEAEQLIETSRDEIERRRGEAFVELEEVREAMDSARSGLRSALDRYLNARREVDRLQVPTEGEFDDDDRIAQQAERHFPEYQVRAYVREVEDGASMFGMLDRRQQYAQMRIWIGRLRRFQHADPGDEERDLLEGVFRRLVSLSKQHEPGYIEAFNRQYAADWDAYIAEAQEALRLAGEDARRGRDHGHRHPEPPAAEPPAPPDADSRRVAEQALHHLRALMLIRYDDPQVKAERFREALAHVVDIYGAPDEPLLELVRPYRDWLTGPDFRELRRLLDQQAPVVSLDDDADDADDDYEPDVDDDHDGDGDDLDDDDFADEAEGLAG